MQGLPLELQEEVLFSLKEPEDLSRVCSSSRGSRQICSDRSFWREKFRRENLPLLEEGSSFSQWVQIYRKSLRAARKTDERLTSGDPIKISLVSLDNTDILKPLGQEKQIKHYWLTANNAGANVGDDVRVVHGFNIELYPGPVITNYELNDTYTSSRAGFGRGLLATLYPPGTRTIKYLTGTVNTEDLWFMLY
ncbi:F-box domain [Cedratvirus A11]|uniref:F-box domain n=1 Tax=Cedratvirus A11 TaxID=1903266 RepID=A0A1M7XUE7_9VIRU|nr:F-box domain [Cedratvirus A11]SHO33311.1 F-box domain [Cedratvirus A11]